jgi:hypothetical protein
MAAFLHVAPAPSASSAEASAGACRTKPGPRFDVKMSGSDEYEGDFAAGHYSEHHRWSAKWKKARLIITRCSGRIDQVEITDNDGTIKTSIGYHEPDIVTEPPACDSGFLCPRSASAASTKKGCNFKHSGRYQATLTLRASFSGRPRALIEGGPAVASRLNQDEQAAQRSACGDTGRVGTLRVPRFQSDGFEWSIDGYRLSATAGDIPELITELAAGRGGSAGAPSTTSSKTSGGGKTTETDTVAADVTFGKGSPIRNRFPDGF